MDKVIVIAGPTASGKTAVSVKLAKKLNTQIVSADSVQVYRKLDIGSAKIQEDEKENIPHHLIDIVDANYNYSMSDFHNDAKKAINDIIKDGMIPIIAGGTGFYIQSCLKDMDLNEEDDNSSYKKELEEIAIKKGNDYLHEMLKEVDEVSSQKIHKNNVKRVIRALEYYKNNNKPISEHNESEKEKGYMYDTKFFVLYFKDRQKLYDRTNMRVDMMIRKGLVEEVEILIKEGVKKDSVSMQAIGYKEVIEYLDGLTTKEEMIEKIKTNTRHLVKRQYTWFKHQSPDAIWICVDEFDYNPEKIACEMMKYID